MLSQKPVKDAITVQQRLEGTFPGGGGCSMNYSKEFSKYIEGDISVERHAFIQYFKKDIIIIYIHLSLTAYQLLF